MLASHVPSPYPKPGNVSVLMSMQYRWTSGLTPSVGTQCMFPAKYSWLGTKPVVGSLAAYPSLTGSNG